MPLYDLQCPHGHRAETLLQSWASANPSCTACGDSTVRLPSAPAMLGRSAPPPAHGSAPRSWVGAGNGNQESITAWRRRVASRAEFENKNPEFATRVDAIASHEGAFERQPLTYRELAERAQSSGDAATAMQKAHDARASPPAQSDG